MKPKNLMLLGFINKAVDYLDKQLDDESASTLSEVNNTDLKVLKEQLSDYVDVSLGSMQSTIETLLKAGGEAFDEFLEVGKKGSLSAELDKLLNVDLDNSGEGELEDLLSFYGLDEELPVGEEISDQKTEEPASVPEEVPEPVREEKPGPAVPEKEEAVSKPAEEPQKEAIAETPAEPAVQEVPEPVNETIPQDIPSAEPVKEETPAKQDVPAVPVVKEPVKEEPVTAEPVTEETVAEETAEVLTEPEESEEDYYDDLFVSDEVNEAEAETVQPAAEAPETIVPVEEETVVETEPVIIEEPAADIETPVPAEPQEPEFVMSDEDNELLKQIEENVNKTSESEQTEEPVRTEEAELDEDHAKLDSLLDEVVAYTDNPDLGFDTSVHGPIVTENPAVDEVPEMAELAEEPEESSENSLNDIDKDDLLKMVKSMQSSSDIYYNGSEDYSYVPEEKNPEPEPESEPEPEPEEQVYEQPDQGEIYVSSLINDLRAQMIKEDEDKIVAEEEYKQIFERIHKLYPYLSNSFVRSVYDLKDSISNEYPLDIRLAVLHRLVFSDVESLRQFVEIAMNHEYQVTADENKLIVDIFKPMINTDGKIITSIFEVANQAALLNGTYDGYQVLYN